MCVMPEWYESEETAFTHNDPVCFALDVAARAVGSPYYCHPMHTSRYWGLLNHLRDVGHTQLNNIKN